MRLYSGFVPTFWSAITGCEPNKAWIGTEKTGFLKVSKLKKKKKSEQVDQRINIYFTYVFAQY